MARVLEKTTDLTNEAWLLARKKGIGGSDISALVGLNKYKSPMKLYLNKIGEDPEDDEIFTVNDQGGFVSGSEAAYWGHKHEQTVADEFYLRTGMKVRRRNAILQHDDHPWALANVDRLIVGKKEGLECKTASEYLNDQWTDESIPDAYYVQCQWYMAVTGLEKWHIAALIGGNKFRHFPVDRDEELIEILLEKAEKFWKENVQAKNPPAWDGSDSSTDLLNAMYPNAEDQAIDLPGYLSSKLKRHDEIKETEKEIKEEKKEIENEIKGLLGETKHGYVNDRKITWSRFTTEKFDKKSFKKDHPEIFNQYVSEGKSSKFSIK